MKQTTQFKSGKILNKAVYFINHLNLNLSFILLLFLSVYAVLFHVFILSFEKIEKKKQYEHSIYYKYTNKPRSNTNRLKLEIYYFLLVLFSILKKKQRRQTTLIIN